MGALVFAMGPLSGDDGQSGGENTRAADSADPVEWPQHPQGPFTKQTQVSQTYQPTSTPPSGDLSADTRRADSPNTSTSRPTAPAEEKSPAQGKAKERQELKERKANKESKESRGSKAQSSKRSTIAKGETAVRAGGSAAAKSATSGVGVQTAGAVSATAQLLGLVNQERAKAGAPALTARSDLAALAQAFSKDMAVRNFFDHTDPDGASPFDRAAKAGVKGVSAENIARGQADARAVMESWMKSPGHRANILNPKYRTFGAGVHFGPGGPWWTQSFGF